MGQALEILTSPNTELSEVGGGKPSFWKPLQTSTVFYFELLDAVKAFW